MKKAKVRKKSPVFTVSVLFLSLILVYRVVSCAQEIYDSINYYNHFSSEDYEYALQYRNYSYLNRIAKNDTSSPSNEFVQACRDIADYFEASILYHSYDTTKNNTAASKELQRMKNCETAWPDYEEYFQDIDQLFTISDPN